MCAHVTADAAVLGAKFERRQLYCPAVSVMLLIIVAYLLVIQLNFIAVSPSVQYADSWAVEVTGGFEKANDLAKKHGLINSGKVRLDNLGYYIHYKGGLHYRLDH